LKAPKRLTTPVQVRIAAASPEGERRRKSGTGAPREDARRHRRRFRGEPSAQLRVLRPESRAETNEAGRGIEDERHEHQAEPEHPRVGVAGQELPEQDVEQRAQRRAEEAAGAADDRHRDDLAGEAHVHGVGRNDRLEKGEQASGGSGQGGGNDEGDQLVTADRIAGEHRTLLVFADGDQHAAEGRANDAQQYPRGGEHGQCGQRVERELVVEIDASERGARDAAQAGFAAGEVGPAVGDEERERREGERQQRKIDAAPAQHEEADDEPSSRARDLSASGRSCPGTSESATAPPHTRRSRRTGRARTKAGPCSRGGG
jgi:hypothetical protein